MAEKEISSKKMRDMYKGCLVGAAVGDALGAPAEFLPPDKIRQQYGIVQEMLGGGVFNWRVGETTDDTDNTLCIVDSLVYNKKYVPEDIANRFLLWYAGRPKDIGGTTRTSLSLLAQGYSWKNSGKIALSLGAGPGNGSLMRTAPLGLYFRGEPINIDKGAEEISSITHADPNCILACQMASHLVAFLATGYSRKDSIDLLKEMYPANTETGYKLRKALDGGYGANNRFSEVFITLSIALTSFIEAQNFEDAVISAIHAGWDTDTQATVTGAFAGALWGINQIPDRWKNKLNPVKSGDLENKADILYKLNKQLVGNERGNKFFRRFFKI